MNKVQRVILSLIFSMVFVPFTSCMVDDTYSLCVKFPPGMYVMNITYHTHTKENNKILNECSCEESWEINAPPSKYPENIFLQLKKKKITMQINHDEESLDLSYEGGQQQKEMSQLQSSLIGPKTGTQLRAHIRNAFSEIEVADIIKHGDPSDSFIVKRFNSGFSHVNQVHSLLPDSKVKIGDSWKCSVINPMFSLGEFSESVNLNLTLEKIEKTTVTGVDCAVISFKIDSKADSIISDMGVGLGIQFDKTHIKSEGKFVINMSNKVLVSYTIKTMLSCIFFGEKTQIQEECRYQVTFISDMSELPPNSE